MTASDEEIHSWEVSTGRERFVLPSKGKLCQIAVSSDGRTLASVQEDGLICLWDILTRKECGCFKGHIGWVSNVAFSPDGKLPRLRELGPAQRNSPRIYPPERLSDFADPQD